MLLNTVANRQSEVGEREDALATVQEAVELSREVAARNRDAFLPDLASSLNNLAAMQGNGAQRQAALATAQEAIALYRVLWQVGYHVKQLKPVC